MEMKVGIEAQIDAKMEEGQELPRSHMGVSTIGHPCERKLWLSFRWAVIEKFDGRILRLFRRGQNEESQVVKDLESIGMRIIHTGKDQKRVDFFGHVSGSVDGIILSGVPESPDKPHILEIKTHSLKSFNDMEKHGVEKSKPLHYVQMQGYMLGLAIERALYVAVCKDDDRIYTERVKLDVDFAKKAVSRAKRIALDERMPPPLSTDPSWYECKWCPCHDFCHVSHRSKEVNCRTCAYSMAREDNTWYCQMFADRVPVDYQRSGCNQHVFHEDLVPEGKVITVGDGRVRF